MRDRAKDRLVITRALRWFALALVLWHGAALSHKPSDSYLTLSVEDATIAGQWDIALRDLDFALGLDANQDGELNWGEVKAQHAQIAGYALSRLTLGSGTAPCLPVVTGQLIDDHTDGAYAVLRFRARCDTVPRTLEVGYRLFAEVDPQHRGLVKLTANGATRASVLGFDTPTQAYSLAAPSKVDQFVEYLREGVVHIWAGLDHILFLLALLLPAVLVRSRVRGQTWTAAPSFRAAFWDVFKVVTAFTVAHSITLSLAALGVIALPSRFVESAIAASVALAALNNVHPLVYGGRWALAFAFGLIHGFGFASVLADLGLPQDALLLSLVAFNLGVELGQLAIVAVFLPVAYALRATRLYRQVILVGGSLVVAAVAVAWLLQRAFGIAPLHGFVP
jgi:hypothetical protein